MYLFVKLWYEHMNFQDLMVSWKGMFLHGFKFSLAHQCSQGMRYQSGQCSGPQCSDSHIDAHIHFRAAGHVKKRSASCVTGLRPADLVTNTLSRPQGKPVQSNTGR